MDAPVGAVGIEHVEYCLVGQLGPARTRSLPGDHRVESLVGGA
jgi:hypothetical protein